MEEEGYLPEDGIEEEGEEFDEEGLRFRWKISTYSLSGLTILLNLIIVLILIFKRNLGSTLNKGSTFCSSIQFNWFIFFTQLSCFFIPIMEQ